VNHNCSFIFSQFLLDCCKIWLRVGKGYSRSPPSLPSVTTISTLPTLPTFPAIPAIQIWLKHWELIGDLYIVDSFPQFTSKLFSSHPGIEPGTFGLEVQRAILCANGTVLCTKVVDLFVIRTK
jgi:hypothetical protein